MGFAEFVVVIAAIQALNPLAMDMMLPALPDIGAAFNIANANYLQTVLSAFLIGFGVGQFAIGPLSDHYGRRRVVLTGMVVYCAASLIAVTSQSFEMLLLARVLQGLGTSATRLIAPLIVRVLRSSRLMASLISLAKRVFILLPVLAPSIGQAVLMITHWRGIFISLMIYGVIALAWISLRLPETLPPANRRPISVAEIFSSYRQTLTNRQTFGYALAAGGIQAVMFAYIFSAQQIFTGIYGLGSYFPLAFAAIASGVAIAGFLNSRFVGRLGMRVISHGALIGFVLVSLTMLVTAKLDMLPLPLFMLLSALSLFSFGLIFANFTAIAMQPHGHIAGTASSLFGSITTLIGIAIGTPIGQHFDGTLTPLAAGFFLSTLGVLVVVLIVERGRLFRQVSRPV